MSILLPILLAACTPNEQSSPSGSSPEDDPEDQRMPMVFRAVGFNVESGGSDPQIVADETVAAVEGEALWGFSEVENDSAAEILVASANDPGTAQDFQYVLGTTGWDDRLVLAWDNEQFELLSSEELDDINIGGDVRSPLVGQMSHRESGQHFTFVVNHLYRTDEAARHEQAALLNAWGASVDGPIVMVGDYNFDWSVTTAEHDEGYDSLVADDVFVWVRPDEIIKTQCSYYNSVLDFVFVGGEAREWTASALILDTDSDYCLSQDSNSLSDHRPVEAFFDVP